MSIVYNDINIHTNNICTCMALRSAILCSNQTVTFSLVGSILQTSSSLSKPENSNGMLSLGSHSAGVH